MCWKLLAILLALGQVAATWPDLGQAPPSRDGAADAAVLVGIEDYAFIADVPGAGRNVADWYRDLRARGVPIDRIVMLRDAQATREEIAEAVRGAATKVAQGGRLWVVFIGHGAPSAEGQGLLVGVDAQQTAKSLAARSLGRAELLEAAADAPTAVVVLDACFSGRDAGGQSLVPGLQPLVPVAAGAPAPHVVVLTAAANDQFAGPLPGENRPAFSYLLLGALRGWADGDADGHVTVKEAHGYVGQTLAALVSDRHQEAQLQAADTAVRLAADRREAGPDLDALRLALGPVAPAVPAGLPTAMVRVVATDDDAFQVAFLAADGRTSTCPATVGMRQPCVLKGLSIGNARLMVDGDAEVTQDVPLPAGSTLIEIEPVPRWALWTGGGLMLGGFATMATMLPQLVDCQGGIDEGSCENEGAFIAGTAVGGGVMVIGMGMLAWAGWRWMALGGEDVHIKHFPAEVGVGVTPGGAVVQVGGGW